MPELPRISGREAIRALERLGFEQIRQRGSHVNLRRKTPNGSIGCTVPLHAELKLGTLHGILKQAQVDPEEFKRQL
jgi:predicted RNA binding protein YcfA (HicA-like mRNA interferase family)